MLLLVHIDDINFTHRFPYSLKVLQKNIMIWSPEQDQRKPPKGSMDLLVSVNHLFDLAESLRNLLMTDPTCYLVH